MKTVLLLLLIIIAIFMIVLGIRADMIPPALTGVGFAIIVLILYREK